MKGLTTRATMKGLTTTATRATMKGLTTTTTRATMKGLTTTTTRANRILTRKNLDAFHHGFEARR